MKKGSAIVYLLLIVIVAVFISFYYNEQEQFMNGLKYFGESDTETHNSPYTSCSSYTPDKCPTKNCLVLTDETQCAGNAEPSNLPPGSKNYDVPSSSYMNDGPATCGSAGYLKTCASKSLQ